MNQNQISSYLKKLEKELLTQNVRKNPDRLDQLMDDNFREIGSSGKVWSKQTAIEALKNEAFLETQIKQFKFTLLDENVALITYVAHKKMKADVPDAVSYHSSVWILRDTEWKMIFHQGTPIVSSRNRSS